MAIISFVSTKGGVGKSTLALNIATQLTIMGHEVSLLDSDPQGSVMKWANIREGSEEPLTPVFVASAMGKALEEMARERSKKSIVLIDSAGVINERSRLAIELADYVFTSSNPEPMELWEVKTSLDVVGLVERKIKRRIPLLLALNRVHPSTRDLSDVAEYLETSMSFPAYLFDTIIRERASYKQSIRTGHAVCEYEDQKAKEEIEAICLEIINIIKS